eukprot:m.13925 g.13925  ORF g.13925 m.13925 type:complete len:297 (-) comp7674_c0_seq1:286-1176(-)
MRGEIEFAIDFICEQYCAGLDDEDVCDLETFREELRQLLEERYTDHWFPSNPDKGCAYRCLEWSKRFVDGSIEQAALKAGMELPTLLSKGPSHLVLWVDPGVVSARIGADENIQVIGSSNNGSPTIGSRSPRSQSPSSGDKLFGSPSSFNGDIASFVTASTSPQSMRRHRVTNTRTTSPNSVSFNSNNNGYNPSSSPQGFIFHQHHAHQNQHQRSLHVSQKQHGSANRVHNGGNASMRSVSTAGMYSPPSEYVGRSSSSPFHHAFQQHQFQQHNVPQRSSSSNVFNAAKYGSAYFS